MGKKVNKKERLKSIYILIFSVVALVFAATSFYFLVLAEDSDDNQLRITNAKIVSVVDGDLSGPFDADDQAGNDSSSNNGIVRTFDNVSYFIQYNLESKSEENVINSTDFRNVVVDILFPNTINGKIRDNFDEGTFDLTPIFNEYKYVELTYESLIGENQGLSFVLSDVYGDNNVSFEPIVLIKEATDTDVKSISEYLNENPDGATASFDTVSSNFNKIDTCTNTVSETQTCSVRISGTPGYYVELFSGSQNRNKLITSIPIGFIVGIEERFAGETSKGIKGALLPNEINFNVSYPGNAGVNRVNYVENSIKSYDGSDYSIYMDENYSVEMPHISAGAFEAIPTDNNLSVTVNSFPTYNNILVNLHDKNYYVISSNSFVITSTREDAMHTDDINVVVTATNGEGVNSSVTVVDKLQKFVGSFQSAVIIKEMDLEEKEYGKAVFNYGQKFTLDSVVQYSSGNELDSLTSYVKIDNDAFKLLIYEDSTTHGVNHGEIVYENSSGHDNPEANFSFGYGEWKTEYFKVPDGAPETCPSLASLTPEQLMNLYGGPCLTYDETKVYWTQDIDGGSIPDDLKSKGVMVIKAEYGINKIYSGTKITVPYQLKVKSNSDLVGNTYQITTSATAKFNGSDEVYYLSTDEFESNVELHSNKDNFTKSEYSAEDKDFRSINTNTCQPNTSQYCGISGNTILVSGIQLSTPTVDTYYNGIKRSTFYHNPVEWRINASSYSNAESEIEVINYRKANLKIYLPMYLERVTGSIDDPISNKAPKSHTEVPYTETGFIQNQDMIDYGKYHVYEFEFDDSELIMTGNGAEIPTFSFYTNFVYYNTDMDYVKDRYLPVIYVVVDFEANPTGDASKTYSSLFNEGLSNVTKEITMHNLAGVNMQGTIIPEYFEKGGSYTFKMQSFNNGNPGHQDEESPYIYENAALYYVLPYKNDSSSEDSSSKFNSTGYKVKLNNPSLFGEEYKVYYTKGESANIITNEIYSNGTGNSWTLWDNPGTEVSNITAIKITKTNPFNVRKYFIDSEIANSVEAVVTPIGSDLGDTYYNAFYIIADRPNNIECNPDETYDADATLCNNIKNSKIFYSSPRVVSSVYNRRVSGYVWEDYNYSGLYESNESRLENIPVTVCKISKDIDTEPYFENDPSTFVSENDDCFRDTVTDSRGRYLINGLTEGNYYVKFVYNSEKYTPTDPFATSTLIDGSASEYNSKAYPYPNKNIAISKIIRYTADNSSTNFTDINLGLKIRKQFAVNINKYITNAEVSTNGNTRVFNYNNATKVTVSLRNPKNAHIKVKYDFVVENVKFFPGYVGVIADKMPDGMTFNSNLVENKDWMQYGNTLYYSGLSGTLLIPGQKYYFSLVLDLDVTQGGTYLNLVAARNLVLMGDEIPDYDFSNLDLYGSSNNQTNTNTNEQNNTDNNQTNNNSSETGGTTPPSSGETTTPEATTGEGE